MCLLVLRVYTAFRLSTIRGELHFVPKGAVDSGHTVVYSDGNGLTITGCDMTGVNRNHIRLGKQSKSTVVTSSRFLGGLKLDGTGTGKVVSGDTIDE